jgi:hypothetical protein
LLNRKKTKLVLIHLLTVSTVYFETDQANVAGTMTLNLGAITGPGRSWKVITLFVGMYREEKRISKARESLLKVKAQYS